MSPSKPFLTLTLSAANPAIDFQITQLQVQEHMAGATTVVVNGWSSASLPASLLGSATQLIFGENQSQHLHGHLHRLIAHDIDAQQHHHYTLEIVTWLALLGLNQVNRVFIQKTLGDILQHIFNQYPDIAHYDLTRLTASSIQLDYVVQYQESDLNFIQRLLESQGGFYYHEHDAKGARLIIADTAEAYVKSTLTLRHHSNAPGHAAIVAKQYQHSWENDHIAQSDYCFETPNAPLLFQAATSTDLPAFYHYPGGFQTSDEGERLTRIRAQAATQRQFQLQLTTIDARLRPGQRFQLIDAEQPELTRNYVVISTHHTAKSQPTASSSPTDTMQSDPPYQNFLVCQVAEQIYRPPMTARLPRIHGVQVAKVIAPAGEIVDTDAYGRVRVEFKWLDAQTQLPAQSTWVRTCQAWAGADHGTLFLPRAGDEAVIGFEHGDPARPFILGSSYNGDNAPPYALPQQQTMSGIKTQSIPGDGFNEIAFEDAAGREHIRIHAQKDLTEEIRNDHHITIGGDHTLTIEQGDQTLEIGGEIAVTAGTGITFSTGASSIQMTPQAIILHSPTILLNE